MKDKFMINQKDDEIKNVNWLEMSISFISPSLAYTSCPIPIQITKQLKESYNINVFMAYFVSTYTWNPHN